MPPRSAHRTGAAGTHSFIQHLPKSSRLANLPVADQLSSMEPIAPPSLEITPVRGMPRWRQRQRELPVAEKIALIGKLILETRGLERIKKSCRLSAISSSNSSPSVL